MARESEKSFPFDSEIVNGEYDRTYTADEFAEYFRNFISSGIFMKESTNLQVVANGDMSVTLHPGKMIIEGHGYTNKKDIIINLDPADGVLDRIDRISITWSKADRDNHCTVQSSTYSYDPIEPECRRTAEYKDYVVADIRVKAGCVSISQEDITDQRLNSEVCGLAMPFAEIDTSEINKKLEAYYERVMKENDSWRQDEKESFDDWFATLQDKLSGDVAANLQLQIDELNDFVDHGSLYSSNTEVFKDLESGFYRLRNYKSDLFPGSAAVTGTMQKNVVGGHHTGTIITTDGVNYTRFADYDSSGTLVSDTGWKKMSVDTLTTMEQVEASTDLSKPVGAGAVQELNSSLGDISNVGNTTYNSVEKILQYYIDNGYLPDLKSMALIPVMTSNTTPSGVASAISEYSTGPAYYAFRNLYDDTSNSECWQANDSVGTSHSNLWLMYKFPKAVTVNKFRIRFVYTNAVNYKIQGSNNGSTFTDLGTFTTIDGTKALQNTNSYLYYRLFITSQTCSSQNVRGGCVRDLQLYGY